ncbi:thiamine biosynthesis lipoprotein [Streptococcus pseudopneumoniae]|uniref:FAD:protein FMN transferase n=1 Tax=Streptococcus pseudopneumoniae TaxID=257758 RepID=A0A0T8TIB1_9STRE|nr:thiamine biosynthesis lipoprotein [Streptococcus pseudopneumoniae]CIO37329.1 thiamine biosynthesis lipoprotein [Streptococcus pseudopneumoniae]CIP56347.1 thiamine biosynthesis lipoprotein [Streptococcus pseudopneumoniae]CJY74249.1 thiamine biosynthesis lipoprotein [Streptococcus pseudopneumoniae]COC83886.1 thiamine biosynthesis lipoprotein [Streptococcus pseudopneumoniae]
MQIKGAQFLRKEGMTSALINLGGSILTIGKNQARGDNPWQIEIQDSANPRGNHLMTIPVVNQSVVTSGIYERHLTVDGQDYHHIFDNRLPAKLES